MSTLLKVKVVKVRLTSLMLNVIIAIRKAITNLNAVHLVVELIDRNRRGTSSMDIVDCEPRSPSTKFLS